MSRFWVITALLLGCAFLGDACNFCVPRDQCLEESPINNYSVEICSDQQVCCDVLRDNLDSFRCRDLSRDQQVCGLSNANGLDLKQEVTNGQAKPGQFPWVVALFCNNEYFAVGSLIAPNVVLTTAHQLRDKAAEDIVVRAGEWDLNSEEEDIAFEEREVKTMTIHDKFNIYSGANNLALLLLEEPFELKDHIRTICLTTPQKSHDGRRCTVTGWGKRKYEDLENSAVLKKVELPVVNRKTCEEQLRTVLGSNYHLPEGLICAGGEVDRDVCSGDGGSPLFCSIGDDNSGVYEQIGIVNWGIKCGQKDIPATYTDVGMFRSWIEEKIMPFISKKTKIN